MLIKISTSWSKKFHNFFFNEVFKPQWLKQPSIKYNFKMIKRIYKPFVIGPDIKLTIRGQNEMVQTFNYFILTIIILIRPEQFLIQ